MPTASDKKIIFLIGATGAQGQPVIKALLEDAEDGTPSPYAIRALTRDPEHRRAKELEHQGVKLIKGDFMDFPTVSKYLKGVYGMFVNTDFFTVGDEGETYGGIRLFELAKYAGVRHFIWSNLDYASKKGNWKEEYACDHHDAKGRVGDYLMTQSNDINDPKSTLYTVLTTGPYMEMLNVLFCPLNERKDGTVVFAAPMGNGHAPLIALKDIAFWVRKTFDNPDTMTGKDLEIVSEVVDWITIIETFTRVTKRPAEYKNLTMDDWRKTFGGLFALMRDDIIKRDMRWIQSVHPNTMTLYEWMHETKYDGTYHMPLKLLGFENDYAPQLREMRITVMLDIYHEATVPKRSVPVANFWVEHMGLPRVSVF
ncbi:hypothetical protein BS47DRAFT_1375104 [Hydnum rufescens UP504]|uniref:NmrA-like domain-containing protein n=1 Tax=Hydnum rufescens UP504 TaxID=1448309 RepID=A0A9P6B8F5_9AGAM|nr:hypothetical protein BS47DRAFT_1375104 [Hydnum rufescens UP504]